MFSAKSSRATISSKRSRTFPNSQEISQPHQSRSPRAESYQYQKKVSTWSYKVLSYLRYAGALLVELTDSSVSCTDEPIYGKAQFQPGMEEVDETPVVQTPSTTAPASTLPTVPNVGSPITDDIAEESYSILQKGLFLAVILGCVAVYLRMNNKKGKQYVEKSMA